MCKRMVVYLVGFLTVAAWTCQADTSAISVHDPLPFFELITPKDPAKLNYLGLAADRPAFSIGEIDAEVVIIEIFSMYCPFCQVEAPKVNTLFSLIDKDRELRQRVKMVGIGVGNSAYEVDFFRESYQVDFPLFPDEDFTIHKLCGEVRTPFFMAVQKQTSGAPMVIMTHLGAFESPEAFLARVLEAGGMKGGK